MRVEMKKQEAKSAMQKSSGSASAERVSSGGNFNSNLKFKREEKCTRVKGLLEA
jgi:hypothetical protein